MKLNSFKLKRLRRAPHIISGILTAIILLVSFQNCSQPGAISLKEGSSLADLGNGANGGGSTPSLKSFSTDTFANTELNTPIDFVLQPVSATENLTGVKIIDQTLTAVNGKLEVIDRANFKVRYTPKTGYRGQDMSMVNGTDDKGNTIAFNVKLVIDNPLQSLKPALAIRGMACIQCHAKVDSNIITDFGFGDSYFMSANMGGDWFQMGGLYGDHGQSFSTIDLKAGVKVLVPANSAFPASVAAGLSQPNLASYLRGRLSASGIPGTMAATVEEKSRIYIGAPLASDITSAFSMKTTDRSLYFKNSENSMALAGLSDQVTYFKNSGVLNCEGDLALRGPLYLNNLQVNSSSGCRLYVIGSVFIYGEIKHINAGENRNLQITSTNSISLGLGLTKKDGTVCETNSQYATDPIGNNVSSLVNRYVKFWTVPSQVTRSGPDAVAAGNAIVAESQVIEAKEGILYDAACRDETRSVSFERLLLNAPQIHGRYEGNFSGTVIAEIAIMSLSQFKFQYDSVFDRTPILPMLKHTTYLDIQ